MKRILDALNRFFRGKQQDSPKKEYYFLKNPETGLYEPFDGGGEAFFDLDPMTSDDVDEWASSHMT